MSRGVVPLIVILLMTGAGAQAVQPPAVPLSLDLPPPPTDPAEALALALHLNGIQADPVRDPGDPTTPTPALDAAHRDLLAALGLPPAPGPLPAADTALAPILADLMAAVAQAATLRTAAMDALSADDRARLVALDAAYRQSREAGDRAILERAVAVHGDLPAAFDRAAIADAADILLEAGLRAGRAIDAIPAADWPAIEAALPGCLIDPAGVVAVCGLDDDTLSGTFALELDLGGDDVHATNAGGSGLGVLFPGPNGLPAALALDVLGDDTYSGDSQVQGSGTSSPGVLVDLEGHDRYLATNGFFTFAQGAGHLGGVGLLYDALGDDLYSGGGWDAQGFGILGGTGVFVEPTGNEYYFGGFYAQGTGDFNAVGLMIDGNGWDRYSASQRSQGFGDGAGLGWLWDGEGNDRYAAGGFSQGAGVGGAGILVDGFGNDVYAAAASAQGWGGEGPTLKPVNDVLLLLGLQLPGAGLFVDGSGSDAYTGPGCNVCAWTGGTGGAGVDGF